MFDVETQVLDFIIPTEANCQSCERGSLDQQSKGSLKIELGCDPKPVKIECL